jgi:hypothetical protein
MKTPDYQLDTIKDEILLRLATDHIKLHETCARSDRMSYEVVTPHPIMPNPPVAYRITFDVKSITRIDEKDKAPVFDEGFAVNVQLPYASGGDPYPYSPAMLYVDVDHKPVWHPNIKYEGDFAGRICGNSKTFGKAYDLGLLAIRIGEILQYKNYLAEHVDPFPEDTAVALWVREYAEPKGIVNYGEGLAVDPRELLKPMARDEEIAIEAKEPPPEAPAKPAIPKIVIKNKDEIKQPRPKIKIKPGKPPKSSDDAKE